MVREIACGIGVYRVVVEARSTTLFLDPHVDLLTVLDVRGMSTRASLVMSVPSKMISPCTGRSNLIGDSKNTDSPVPDGAQQNTDLTGRMSNVASSDSLGPAGFRQSVDLDTNTAGIPCVMSLNRNL